MNKFKIRMKDPVFAAIKVDQEFLDTDPNGSHFWKSEDTLFCDDTKVDLGDWIVFVRDEHNSLIPHVITDKTFQMFYEVVEDTA